jgi:hypothetical protein
VNGIEEVPSGTEVVALAGRRPDAPDASNPRFPPENAGMVAGRVRALLQRLGAGTLVSAAACGADLLALEAAGELRMRRVVVLPFAPGDFRRASVADRPGDWGTRFDAVLAEVVRRGDLVVFSGGAPGTEACAAANEAILERALALGGAPTRVRAVVVWNGHTRGGGDLTGAFLEQARARGIACEEVLTLDPPSG